jgi:hypothetical protein
MESEEQRLQELSQFSLDELVRNEFFTNLGTQGILNFVQPGEYYFQNKYSYGLVREGESEEKEPENDFWGALEKLKPYGATHYVRGKKGLISNNAVNIDGKKTWIMSIPITYLGKGKKYAEYKAWLKKQMELDW